MKNNNKMSQASKVIKMNEFRKKMIQLHNGQNLAEWIETSKMDYNGLKFRKGLNKEVIHTG